VLQTLSNLGASPSNYLHKFVFWLTGLFVSGGPAYNLSIKEEPLAGSRASSEQGEEEMEVDSNEEQEEEGEQRSAGGAFSQTLSALSSLRPGKSFHDIQTGPVEQVTGPTSA